MNDSKYTRWYKAIIHRAQSSGRSKDHGYFELHHVVPKSVDPSISNLRRHPTNGVLLTAREHYVCHLLLTKMYDDPKIKHKMIWALHRMVFGNTHLQNRPALTSRQYEVARRLHSANMKNNHPSKRDPERWRAKKSEDATLNWRDNDGRRRAAANKLKETWATRYSEMIEHARKAGKKGSEISAARRRGKKFPEWGRRGTDNPATKTWTIVEPDGNVVTIQGLSDYCKRHNLNSNSVAIYANKGKAYKGYFIHKPTGGTR